MRLRAFYWKARVSPVILSILKGLKYPKSSYFFKNGNFGDLFFEDLVKYCYGPEIEISLIKENGKRLLLIGSIVQVIQSYDLICGAGSKFDEVPKPPNHYRIAGLRGPLTYETMRRAGYDLSQVKFLYDPGLLVRYIYPEDSKEHAEANGAIFIPHYRERYRTLKLPQGVRMCDPDDSPVNIASKIKQSELVYASSLHGIIFAHAYGRPAIYVRPSTNEPSFKYNDYFTSVGLAVPKPLDSIESIDIKRDITKSPNFRYRSSDFEFPDPNELLSMGLMS